MALRRAGRASLGVGGHAGSDLRKSYSPATAPGSACPANIGLHNERDTVDDLLVSS